MNKLKLAVCIIANIALFSLAITGFNNISRNKEIVSKQNPIIIKILDVTYRAKSASTCKVEFNNKVYNDVNLPKKAKIGSLNYSDFYYDVENDIVFHKDENIGAFYVVCTLSFFSLLLWFVPEKKFKW